MNKPDGTQASSPARPAGLQLASSVQDQVPLDPDPIRAHVFDGDIREYDKCMPNWWLFTFWGGVIFSFGYWIWTQELGFERDPGVAVKEQTG